jgi:hypothetical protein
MRSRCRRGRPDQAIESVEGEYTLNGLRGDHQLQLRAGDEGTLAGTQHGIRARMIAGDRRGQVYDQLGGAAVDDRQQLSSQRELTACLCSSRRLSAPISARISTLAQMCPIAILPSTCVRDP